MDYDDEMHGYRDQFTALPEPDEPAVAFDDLITLADLCFYGPALGVDLAEMVEF